MEWQNEGKYLWLSREDCKSTSPVCSTPRKLSRPNAALLDCESVRWRDRLGNCIPAARSIQQLVAVWKPSGRGEGSDKNQVNTEKNVCNTLSLLRKQGEPFPPAVFSWLRAQWLFRAILEFVVTRYCGFPFWGGPALSISSGRRNHK
jgi:hypothetical protein